MLLCFLTYFLTYINACLLAFCQTFQHRYFCFLSTSLFPLAPTNPCITFPVYLSTPLSVCLFTSCLLTCLSHPACGPSPPSILAIYNSESPPYRPLHRDSLQATHTHTVLSSCLLKGENKLVIPAETWTQNGKRTIGTLRRVYVCLSKLHHSTFEYA